MHLMSHFAPILKSCGGEGCSYFNGGASNCCRGDILSAAHMCGGANETMTIRSTSSLAQLSVMLSSKP